MPITIDSGNLIIIDPSSDINHSSLIIKVKKGKWKAYKEEGDCDGFGWKVYRLVMVHIDYTLEEMDKLMKNENDLGLDYIQYVNKVKVTSGYAGMYDIEEFKRNKKTVEFFSKIGYGMTIESGNGIYNVYKVDKNEEAVFVEIDFIDNNC